MWLAAVTGARRGELCGLQWGDIDLDAGLVHIGFSYFVRDGQKMRKDTKTHQERYLAIDAVTAAVLDERKRHVQAPLVRAGTVRPRPVAGALPLLDETGRCARRSTRPRQRR